MLHTTLAGCPSEKNANLRSCKEIIANYISTVEFGKKKDLDMSSALGAPLLKRKKQTNLEWPIVVHSTELIGYLTQAVMFKYCTVLISKHKTLKSCRGFPVFL